MGRAARWLKALLGGKKAAAVDEPKPFREKKRWGFVKSFREKDKSTVTEPPPPPVVAASYRVVSGDGDAQNKRAIAVAAATAAVAEAAVAAAQAAAAVVRLTSSGRIAGVGGAKREEPAAVKIQAAFRGYLARRALRALKGLVKLQAIVRGNIVRRQAAETMRCMQALVRVQARARACRALRSDRNTLKFGSHNHPGPATPEKFEQSIQSNPRRSSPLKRNSSKQASFSDGFDQDRAQSSSAFKWLGQWMEESYWEPISKSGAVAMSSPLDDEKSAKILEIDTGKPNHHNSNKRRNNSHLHSSPLSSDVQSRSFTTTMLDSPSKDSTAAQRSVPSPSSVCMQEPLSPLQFPIVEGSDYALSPQFFSAYSSRPVSSRRGGPVTPAKSDCSRSLFSECSDCPSYMANTESSRAKWRSQSAPKQRPEFEKSSSVVRRLSGTGAGQRSSSSLHAKFANKAYPGSGRLDRLGMPLRI